MLINGLKVLLASFIVGFVSSVLLGFLIASPFYLATNLSIAIPVAGGCSGYSASNSLTQRVSYMVIGTIGAILGWFVFGLIVFALL